MIKKKKSNKIKKIKIKNFRCSKSNIKYEILHMNCNIYFKFSPFNKERSLVEFFKTKKTRKKNDFI